MKKTIAAIILATLFSLVFSTTSMAASYESGLGPEWDAYMAEMEANANIARQNKDIYDATATKLQKKVDALIDKAISDDPKTVASAVNELINLKNSTKDWSSNIVFPLPSELPPRAILLKTGYAFDPGSIGSGDLRPFVWVIEDGEICSTNLDNLPEVLADGGFHESVNKILNHPRSGVVRNEDGHEWYWWTLD